MPHLPQEMSVRRAKSPTSTGRASRWLIRAAVGPWGVLLCFIAAGCASRERAAELVYFPADPQIAHVVHLKSFNALGDLVPVRNGWLDVLRGRRVNPYVATPAGITFHEGHLFICDTGLNVVHDWDLATGTAKRIGASGDAKLATPVAVAVGPDGALYVADTSRGEVVAFDSAGGLRHRCRPPDASAYRPVAVAARGADLYVADVVSHRIDVFNADDGRYVRSFGGIGSDPGKLYFPAGLSADGKGHLLVSDMMNSRVQKLDPEGSFRSSIGQPGNRYGDLGKPRHLAVGPDGTIFIADSEFAHVHLFNGAGELLLLIGGESDEPGGTPMPAGVTVATAVPEAVAAMVPAGFRSDYYLFTTSSVGSKTISVFAVGAGP